MVWGLFSGSRGMQLQQLVGRAFGPMDETSGTCEWDFQGDHRQGFYWE